MRKLFVFFILAFAFQNSKAQIIDYDFSVHHQPKVKQYWQIFSEKIDQTNYAASPDTMEKYLLKMFSIMEPFNEHIQLLSWVYHLKKDYKNSLKYYELSIAKGFLPYCEFSQAKYITGNDSIPIYKKFIKKLDSLKLHPNCAMDIPFCNLVIALFEIDQTTRVASFFKKDEQMKSDTLFRFEKYVGFYDSINLKRLLKHIDQFGIPHQNMMTKEAYTAFHLLVHHLVQETDSSENKRLYTLVRTAIEDGRLEYRFLKMTIDYMHWRNNGQYFGTVSVPNYDGNYELHPPIIEPENVDKRRAEWLFEPLEVQMRNVYDSNYVLPQGYKPFKK